MPDGTKAQMQKDAGLILACLSLLLIGIPSLSFVLLILTGDSAISLPILGWFILPLYFVFYPLFNIFFFVLVFLLAILAILKRKKSVHPLLVTVIAGVSILLIIANFWLVGASAGLRGW